VVKEVAPTVRIPKGGQLNVVYYPQMGFLVALSRCPFGVEAILDDNAQLDVLFSTEAAVYCKNERMRQLDADIGDVTHDMSDIEIDIARQLQGQLPMDMLRHLATQIALLDTLNALSQAKQEQRLCLPSIKDQDEETCMAVYQGRHPLLSQAVAHDYRVLSGVNVLTGPNASGKSVLLRECGLQSVLTQCGIGAKADLMSTKLFNRLSYLRSSPPGTSEESTFSHELQALKEALASETGCILLLIDEFAKGTSPTDAISLVTGLIRYLSEHCPHRTTLLVTHYTDIYQFFQYPRALDEEETGDAVNWLHMQVNYTGGLDQDNDQELTGYTYQVREGRMSAEDAATMAFRCALRSGLSPDIVDRARQIMETIGPLCDVSLLF
jgi:DNA mismatch repair ATPase MutS